MAIKGTAVLSIALIFNAGLLADASGRFQACLPYGVSPDYVVTTKVLRSASAEREVKKITVEQTLTGMKARCKNGKLADAKGKPIHFYRLQGCWGNPPENYQEILKEQQRELESLKQRYTVIEMTCNPEGDQPR